MARAAREKSESGIYHIMLRGINRQDLFKDDEDRQRFIETLIYYKEKSGYKIYAYCLMNNHVHILIKEEKEPLALFIKRISSSYVHYYNRKYARCGHLFQDRFKSEIVEDNIYFITVLRYIHQNPIKASMIKTLEEYKWSSYNEYIKAEKITDTDFVLNIFSKDKAIATQEYISFNSEQNDDKCLEYQANRRINDVEAREIIINVAKVEDVNEIQNFNKEKKNEIIRTIKVIDGLSIRQIARITGLNYNLVLKL